MKISKDLQEHLDRIICQRSSIPVDELVDEIRKYAEMPDMEYLLTKELRSTARRFLARHKDKTEARIWAVVPGESKGIKVDVSESREEIEKLINRCRMQIIGESKNLKKYRKKLAVLDGQISMEEYLSEYGS